MYNISIILYYCASTINTRNWFDNILAINSDQI